MHRLSLALRVLSTGHCLHPAAVPLQPTASLIDSRTQVHLKSGAFMDMVELRQQLQLLDLFERLTPGEEGDDTPRKGGSDADSDGGLADVYLNAALVELMGRYGTARDRWQHTCHPDHAAHDAACGDMHPAWARTAHTSHLAEPIKAGEDSEDVLKVLLTVGSARGVSGMDLWRGADLYCVAFIGDWSSGAGRAADSDKGNEVFQTAIKPGRTEAEWKWDEVCGSVPPADESGPCVPLVRPHAWLDRERRFPSDDSPKISLRQWLVPAPIFT